MQPFVIFIFLLSGISALTLEVVWTRMLEHVFGATTLAVATVLTCFMGGLALGSWVFGRYADKIRSPLVAYGIAEGIVGFCAFVIPVLVESLYPGLNRWMVANLSNSFWQFSVIRFLSVAVILIVPTTCMGATLPLLSRHFMTNEGHMARIGARIGMLYTINTLGAIFGVFLTTFVLLPTIGLALTNTVAGSINLSLCASVFVLYFWAIRRKNSKPPEDNNEELELALVEESVRNFTSTKIARWVTGGAFFLSGLASMNLQVVWNRAMAMVIGASVYSFSLVLIAFLVGLSAGAAVFSKLSERIKNPVMVLALVELGVALAAMANYLYMDDLPKIFATLVTEHIGSFEHHVGLVQFLMFTVAALAVLPATFFMGATFPLTIRIVSQGLGRIGRDVGSVYAMNTMGAICGSFLSAFVFVPVFSHYFGGSGMQTTFFLSVGIYTLAGLMLLLVSSGSWIPRVSTAAISVVLVLGFVFSAPAWDPAALTIGVFRLSLMKTALNEEAWGDPDIRYYYDGVSTTVSVEMWGRHFALKNNGKVDASNGDDMPTQIMVAAYPLLLHEAGPKDLDVAIVGFGSGVTVGAALEFPIKHVDVMELENAVIAASEVFGQVDGEHASAEFNVNHLIYRRVDDLQYNWTDPDTFVINDRLTIFNNDGRNFLASSPKKYDVIISEPSNPWITGVSNMFTEDNFHSATKALKPNGIYCQWVQLYEMSPQNIKTIFRTFASVFPHVILFSAEDLSADTMLIGSFEPIQMDLERVRSAMNNTKVSSELARAYIFSATDVFARVLLVDRDEIFEYTNGPKGQANKMPINTDDNALIEFSAPHDLIAFNKYAGYLATIYTSQWRFGRLSNAVVNFGKGEIKARNLAKQAVSLLTNGRKDEAGRFLVMAEEISPGEPNKFQEVANARRMFRLLRGEEGVADPVFEEVVPSPSMSAEQATSLRSRVADVDKSIRAEAYQDALGRFFDIPDELWRRGGPQMLLLKGYLHFLNAEPDDPTECEETIEILSQLVREYPAYVESHPQIHYYLSLCHDNALHFDKAVKNIRLYLDLLFMLDERLRLSMAQAQANLEADLLGMEGTATIALPADPKGSTTTDAQGESPKSFRTINIDSPVDVD